MYVQNTEARNVFTERSEHGPLRPVRSRGGRWEEKKRHRGSNQPIIRCCCNWDASAELGKVCLGARRQLKRARAACPTWSVGKSSFFCFFFRRVALGAQQRILQHVPRAALSSCERLQSR